jgi:Flp pilus assembly protein TadG
MKTHWNALKQFCREQRGVAAVELTIALPILTVSALCVGDLGRFALQKTWVTYAAAAGADYAVANYTNGFNASAIEAAAEAAAPVGAMSGAPAPSEFYGRATATGVTASTQGAICPSSTSTGGIAGEYVSVTATMPFTALFSAAGISYPSTVTATAVVRVQ